MSGRRADPAAPAGRGIRRDYLLPRASLFGPRPCARRSTVSTWSWRRAAASASSASRDRASRRWCASCSGWIGPTAGTVRYRGRVIEPGRPRQLRWFRRDAQVVLQDPLSSLDPRMTVALDRARAARLPRRAGRPRRAAIIEVLEAVGLDPAWRRALSARVLRRPAAADRHRPRDRPSARHCSSATNRSARSTCPCGCRSSTCCRTSPSSTGCAWSWSPTTSVSCATCAMTSSSCVTA